MSAWGIGTTAGNRRRKTASLVAAGRATPETPGAATVETLITWIPGEVVVFYTAVVVALQPESDGGEATLVATSYVWLITGVALACALAWLGAWSSVDGLHGKATREAVARTILAAVAFIIWSFIVPGSWWYSVPEIASQQDLVPILVTAAGAIFALLAEGIVRRIGD